MIISENTQWLDKTPNKEFWQKRNKITESAWTQVSCADCSCNFKFTVDFVEFTSVMDNLCTFYLLLY